MRWFLILFLWAALPSQVQSQVQAPNQKFLVLDRYTTKRIKLYEGDFIWFKLKNDDFRMKDYIKELKDSTLVLAKRNKEIRLTEIESFYFTRSGWQLASRGLGYIGGGFLLSAAVYPLMGNPQYDQRESAITGLTALAISQFAKLFHRKRYQVTDNTRVRIIEIRFDKPASEAGSE